MGSILQASIISCQPSKRVNWIRRLRLRWSQTKSATTCSRRCQV